MKELYIVVNLKNMCEKERLAAAGFSLFAINFIIYICLLYCAECFINYDLFHKTVHLTDYGLLLEPISYCIMLFCIMLSYFVVDTEAEPVFKIFNGTEKLDFYVRICAVIMAFVLIKSTININNKFYLYILLFVAFAFNFYLESNMYKIISKTTDEDIEFIRNNTKIKLSEEKVEKYKEALKKGKISFFIIFSLVIFNSVLSNIVITVIFFFIYSTVIIFLLKNMYFLLYERRKAINKLSINSFIMLCGFILMLLLNEKVIVLRVYNFSPQELISLISFFTFPLYYPVRIVYLSLRHSDNL